MWEQIGAAAIYGAIGGGGGALIGALLAAPFRKSKIGSIMATVLTVAGAVIGYNVSEPLLKPYIGQYLPTPPANDFDAQLDATFQELETLPTFSAILEREPDLRDALRQQLVAAANDANSSVAARQLAFSASYNEVQGRFIHYLQRSTNGDLLAFYANVNQELIYFSAADPKFCFDSNYNPGALAALDLDAIRAKYGDERFNRQQELGSAVVKNAYDEIPPYDVDEAQAALERGGVALRDVLGEENTGMVTGAKAVSTVEEYKLVCDASIALNNSLLNEADAAAVIRHIFTLAG